MIFPYANIKFIETHQVKLSTVPCFRCFGSTRLLVSPKRLHEQDKAWGSDINVLQFICSVFFYVMFQNLLISMSANICFKANLLHEFKHKYVKGFITSGTPLHIQIEGYKSPNLFKSVHSQNLRGAITPLASL